MGFRNNNVRRRGKCGGGEASVQDELVPVSPHLLADIYPVQQRPTKPPSHLACIYPTINAIATKEPGLNHARSRRTEGGVVSS